MMSWTFVPPAVLAQWAAQPWSYWYQQPERRQLFQGIEVPVGPTPVTLDIIDQPDVVSFRAKSNYPVTFGITDQPDVVSIQTHASTATTFNITDQPDIVSFTLTSPSATLNITDQPDIVSVMTQFGSQVSGPPYPPSPGVGSNSLDVYGLGIPNFDWWQTVESQYANSLVIDAYLESYNDALDQTTNFSNFYYNIWNIDTATGYGLDVWGRIVGITRVIKITGLPIFGFEESGTAFGFNQGMLYQGANSTQNYVLNDQQFRQLILAKARANISDDSIPSINNILMNLFLGRGNAWVGDDGSTTNYFGFLESGSAEGFNQAPFYNGGGTALMGMSYNFDFPLTPIDIGIINSGVLPKPAGVPAVIVVV